MKTDRIIRTHPLQSKAWGEFRSSMGIDVVYTDYGQLTFHQIPHTSWTIGYFPKGPEPTASMIENLTQIGKQKNAIFIQLEPNVSINSRSQNLNISASLKPSAHPLFTKYTFVIDLSKSEEELLKSMHSKTRYNIRVAQKHGVTIQEDNSDESFNTYLKLSEETTSRQGFYAHNKTYHQTMWKILRKADIAHLFTATYQGQVLAAWVLFIQDDTIYYPYGASSRDHREVMAPNLLLWEIIRWAKEKNLKYFDLWGAIGPNPDPNDPWYGFHRFKEGFKPDLIEYVGSYDLILKPLLYGLYTIADKIRWTLLKKKR
jgi:lipid II:glycine glycyltransferase (peptidoglycan interpeptide bridge formation enzyme)